MVRSPARIIETASLRLQSPSHGTTASERAPLELVRSDRITRRTPCICTGLTSPCLGIRRVPNTGRCTTCSTSTSDVIGQRSARRSSNPTTEIARPPIRPTTKSTAGLHGDDNGAVGRCAGTSTLNRPTNGPAPFICVANADKRRHWPAAPRLALEPVALI